MRFKSSVQEELAERIQELALQLVERALTTEDADLKLDAFKILSQFWLGVAKSGKLEQEQEGDGVLSMAAIRAKLKAAEQ